MSTKYLDSNGLSYLWQKIKDTFALSSDIPTATSDLTNDSGFITSADVPEGSTASTTTPAMDGTASVGSETAFARGDHVHPTDTSRASSNHTHGNITNAGALQTNDITIANGDKLVVTDSSNSSKVARTSVSFDGSTTTKALTQKGTFETFNNYSHPTYTAQTGKPTANQTPAFGGTATVSQVTSDSTGHVSGMTDRTIKIPDATATQSADGLMSSTDKTKLDGVATGANNYTHPTYTSKTSGLYKVTVDGTGHVSATASVGASDIPELPASKISSGTFDSARIPDLSSTYQVKLVSGTNIKTINNTSLLGSGNISISGGGGGEANVQSDWNETDTNSDAYILNKPTIPSKTSDLQNDSGYLTSYTETDPTVPSWAKASSKPSYTASEVGALPDTTSIPTKLSDLTNDKLASSLFVVEKVSSGISISTSTSGASGSKEYTKTGYTCLGVVGYDCQGTGVTQANVYRLYWDGSKVYAYVRTATSTTITVYPYLLWLKTS